MFIIGPLYLIDDCHVAAFTWNMDKEPSIILLQRDKVNERKRYLQQQIPSVGCSSFAVAFKTFFFNDNPMQFDIFTILLV